MREIKFRAWDTKEKEMIDLEPNMSYGDYRNFELMQYTGLKDKKGKEIYEGDILRYNYFGRDKRKKVNYEYTTVKWDTTYTGFSPFSEIWGYGLARFDDFYEWEVIGNIYENPELLKV